MKPKFEVLVTYSDSKRTYSFFFMSLSEAETFAAKKRKEKFVQSVRVQPK